VSLADVPRLYHVNVGADGKRYAMVSMHIITKLVPNWTWATFEHALNPARCDILGCVDQFGAQSANVKSNEQLEQGYSDCAKSPALKSLIAAATWDPAFEKLLPEGLADRFHQ